MIITILLTEGCNMRPRSESAVICTFWNALTEVMEAVGQYVRICEQQVVANKLMNPR